MPLEKTDAIVIRLVEFSETSLIVTLFSRQFGRLSAIAKGARRPKGPFEGAIDLLAVGSMEVLRKPGDTLDLLTEAKLIRRFRAANKSLGRLYSGYYLAELLARWTDDDDPHPELYDLAVRTLERIDGADDPLLSILHFEVRTMRFLGHLPITASCASCGQQVNRRAERIPFVCEAGGVMCPACRSRQRGVLMVHHTVLDWLDHLQELPALNTQRVIDPNLTAPKVGDAGLPAKRLETPQVRELAVASTYSAPYQSMTVGTYRQLRALMNRYITGSIGHRLRTQSMLPAGRELV